MIRPVYDYFAKNGYIICTNQFTGNEVDNDNSTKDIKSYEYKKAKNILLRSPEKDEFCRESKDNLDNLDNDLANNIKVRLIIQRQ